MREILTTVRKIEVDRDDSVVDGNYRKKSGDEILDRDCQLTIHSIPGLCEMVKVERGVGTTIRNLYHMGSSRAELFERNAYLTSIREWYGAYAGEILRSGVIKADYYTEKD